MASKFQAKRDEKVKLRTRKGHDMAWSCDIHGEPIKFYCKQHEIPLCHPCATKDHQKPCHLDNIGDVVLELVRKLDDKWLELKETKPHLHNIDSKIQTCLADARNHLQSIASTANATFENKIESAKDKTGDTIRSINERADDEVRLINEKREKRIKSCNEEAEQQQLIIELSQAKVKAETKEISEVVSKKIKDLKTKNQHAISTMGNIDARIKRIKQNDKTIVNEAHQVLASLNDSLNLNVHQDVMDCLDQIQHKVQGVKFVEGEVGGEHYGRIDGYIGKWEFVKSIHIPPIVKYRQVCGLIGADEICVQDVQNNATYVTNISTEHTQKVIEGGSSMSITSCARIDSNVIVCGKWRGGFTGDSLDGFITLYDRQWKVIRDISIPRNNRSNDTGARGTAGVNVDVDRDGMILAAQSFHSNIYVINPADGKIENTITMQGDVVKGEIQALSSGDIVVKTGLKEFTVISRSGEVKAAIHSDERSMSRCRVDKLTDTLYTAHLDRKRRVYAVDQVPCDGIIQARRIVEYHKPDRGSTMYISPCLVTPSGNLVACAGDKLFVYKKSFIV